MSWWPLLSKPTSAAPFPKQLIWLSSHFAHPGSFVVHPHTCPRIVWWTKGISVPLSRYHSYELLQPGLGKCCRHPPLNSMHVCLIFFPFLLRLYRRASLSFGRRGISGCFLEEGLGLWRGVLFERSGVSTEGHYLDRRWLRGRMLLWCRGGQSRGRGVCCLFVGESFFYLHPIFFFLRSLIFCLFKTGVLLLL